MNFRHTKLWIGAASLCQDPRFCGGVAGCPPAPSTFRTSERTHTAVDRSEKFRRWTAQCALSTARNAADTWGAAVGEVRTLF